MAKSKSDDPLPVKRQKTPQIEPACFPERSEIDAIVSGTHRDPFAVLGLHEAAGRLHARCFIPDARTVSAYRLDGHKAADLQPVGQSGFFTGSTRLRKRQPLRYHAANEGGDWWVTDPYSFSPVLGPVDDYLFAEGRHLRLFDKMGAHPIRHEGVDGIHFAVWAPNAMRVSVVGDFNGWDGRRNLMRLRLGTGVFEAFVPDLGPGEAYKYEILGQNGVKLPLKADPFAFRSELRPKTASLTAGKVHHDWGDAAHCDFWSKADPRAQPVAIYEVHAASWQRHDDGGFLDWDTLAARLIPYCVDMGFTHIEFMPVSEYPYDPSWGYQTTGLFAPSARFGDPAGLARFVDGAHRAGLGVFIDWVPAHFPLDEHGLARFDGTSLYEHEDASKGYHPDWHTAIYNFGRTEVKSFLINNALYWSEVFHIDGLRVDAVASMLYLDYSRKEGEWAPNSEGGRENLEAVAFLKELNRDYYGAGSARMTIAEESTAWPKVTAPVHAGGLGFGFKWNMGFMNDTLAYMAREPIHRKYHHHEMTFAIHYGFSENFVLPLSHDEVVHGKGSLLSKMSGDDGQKFASLRAYYAFMWGHPGKKLLFMGQEFAQRREWTEEHALDWHLTDAPAHAGVRDLVRDLNRLYTSLPALHQRDCEADGFEWLVADDAAQSVFAWARHAPKAPPIVVVSNLTPIPRANYRIPLPVAGEWREILNTDAAAYGGSNGGNGGVVRTEDGAAVLQLPPLTTLYLSCKPQQAGGEAG